MMIDKIFNLLNELNTLGYTEEELANLLINVLPEFTNDMIEEAQLQQHLIIFAEVYQTKNLNSLVDDKRKILFETITPAVEDELLKDKIFINTLLELTKYDKIIIRNSKQKFFLIDLLFQNYLLHQDSLKLYDKGYNQNDVDANGIAFSRSTTSEAIISKQMNFVSTLLKTMPENKELQFRKNIYKEYLKDPASIDYCLYSVSLFGNIKALSDEKNLYLQNVRKFINVSKPIQKKDIIKSINLILPLLFHRTSSWTQVLKIKKKLSINKLIVINEILMQYLYDTKNILNKNNLKNSIQVRTNFYKTPLYEFQTKKNKKAHPILKDTQDIQEYWQALSEYIKGKIPLKQSR